MTYRTRQQITCAAVAAAALLSPSVAAAADGDEAKPSETHCVVEVIGQEDSGEFIVTEPYCEATRAQAYASLSTTSSLAGSFTIGVHYDGFNYTGSSFSVVGSDCTGGYLNLSSTWINRVSSTSNGCYRIAHYDGYNKTGASQSTYGFGGNLTTLNNDANSIAYFAS